MNKGKLAIKQCGILFLRYEYVFSVFLNELTIPENC